MIKKKYELDIWGWTVLSSNYKEKTNESAYMLKSNSQVHKKHKSVRK